MNSPASRRVALPSGLTLHMLEWGADDPGLDHTVLLLHGFLENAWAWEETVAAGLAGRFHLLALDFRGHGDSDRVGAGGDYYLTDHFADLDDLIPLVRRARLSIVGHSMGGAIASLYAGARPDALWRLVIMEGTGLPGPPSLGPPERAARWLRRRAEVRARPQSSYATVDEAAARLRKSDPTLRPELAARLAEKGTRPGSDGRLRFKHDPRLTAGGAYVFDVEQARAFWAKVACPVFIVEGERSAMRLPPDEARHRWSAFGKLRRTAVLPGAGHMMQRDQPAALARMLAQMLTDGEA